LTVQTFDLNFSIAKTKKVLDTTFSPDNARTMTADPTEAGSSLTPLNFGELANYEQLLLLNQLTAQMLSNSK